MSAEQVSWESDLWTEKKTLQHFIDTPLHSTVYSCPSAALSISPLLSPSEDVNASRTDGWREHLITPTPCLCIHKQICHTNTLHLHTHAHTHTRALILSKSKIPRQVFSVINEHVMAQHTHARFFFVGFDKNNLLFANSSVYVE